MPSILFSDQTSWQGAFVSVGSFDGVHRGHRRLLEQMVQSAREDQSPAVAVTFFPHPRAVLPRDLDAPPFRYLTTLPDRVALLESIGLDAVLTQPFDAGFAATPAAGFLELLRSRLGMRSLWCGPGFSFGRNREGSVSYLTEHTLELGFQTYILPPLFEGGEPVSSTRIRTMLAEGDAAGAARMLGRPYSLRGEVVHGAQRGRSIGYPTANLSPRPEILIPGYGIYATIATVGGGRYPSVTSIGIRPTFADTHPAVTVETYLLDYSGDLYGQELQLAFHARLREEIRFGSVDALRDQIRKDVEQARSILREAA
jgi:riboflavin kinase/FMN adenylyltransferase